MSQSDQTPDMQIADAAPNNWVDNYAPVWARPYLRLSRADRPIGTWLLLIPCLWGVGLAAAHSAPKTWDIWIVMGCVIGSLLMRGAGCTWNDISDRDIDGSVERTRARPIPARQVTVRKALIWAVSQCLISALILLSYNWFTIGLGVLALLPVAIYPFAKRFTWWPQAFLGLAFNWGALLGWAAVTGGLSLAPFALYFAGIAWTLFYDTIYAHQDKEDDALIGVRSTARLLGAQTPRWLLGFQIVSVLMMTLAVILALKGSGDDGTFNWALIVALVAPWAFGAHLTWQLRRLDIDDVDVCLSLFRSNRDSGLLPAGILALLPLFFA